MSTQDPNAGKQGELTATEPVVTLSFLEEAIDFAHPLNRGFCPSFLFDDLFHLFSKSMGVLGRYGETIQRVREGLYSPSVVYFRRIRRGVIEHTIEEV